MSYQAFGCVVYLFFGNTEIGMHRRVQPMGSAVATTTKGHASGHRNRSMTRSLSADVALWMGLHTTTSQYNSISFTLHGCGIQHQITAGWTSGCRVPFYNTLLLLRVHISHPIYWILALYYKAQVMIKRHHQSMALFL